MKYLISNCEQRFRQPTPEPTMASKSPSVQDEKLSSPGSTPLWSLQNEPMNLILDSIPLKIFWKDNELNFGGCNQAFCEDAGIDSPSEIVGLTDFDMPWTHAEAEFYRSCDRTIMDRNESEIGIIETQTSADGELSWVETSKVPLHNESGEVVGILGIYHDVTEIKRAEQELQQSHEQLEQSHDELEMRVLERTRELQYIAQHDCLTNLFNREQFLRRLNVELESSESQFALLFIDLDRFKSINDNFGHGAGDQLLIQVSEILEDSVRPNDVVGRFGGDEFVVLLRSVRNIQEVMTVSDRIQSALRSSIVIEQNSMVVTASIGIVVDQSTRYESAADVLRDADIAMYQAKGSGKARHQVFNEKIYRESRARLTLEHDMRSGLLRDEFFLQYQPVCNLRTGKLSGFEALVRWQHPTRGIVTPNHFISLAEETGLIIDLGESILKEACQQLAVWRKEYPEETAGLTINVNLSAAQLSSDDYPALLDRVVLGNGLTPADIKIELTENLLLKDDELFFDLFCRMRDRGYKLLLDDFGTGFCSLSYLHRFPIDSLKIDRSFIQSMKSDEQSDAIVRTIFALARVLDVEVIAEGVETTIQEETLREMGCEYAQGFLYSKPLDPDIAMGYVLSSEIENTSGVV